MDDNPDHGAVLLYLCEVLLNFLFTEVIGPLSAGLVKGLLLGLRPVIVEYLLGLLADVFGPNSLEGPESLGGLDIPENTGGNKGRGLDDGNSLHDLLVVHLGPGSVHLTMLVMPAL